VTERISLLIIARQSGDIRLDPVQVSGLEEHFTGLPFLIFFDDFHQRHKITLLADSSRPALLAGFSRYAVSMTDEFNLVRIQLNHRPIGQRLGSRDQVTIPFPGVKSLAQTAQGDRIPQGETAALGTTQADQVRADA
jgi:hypothetical protein